MISRIRRWLGGRSQSTESPSVSEELDQALAERSQLLQRKERVLATFREAQKTLARERGRP